MFNLGTANLNLTASTGSFIREMRRANSEMSFTVRNMGRMGKASEAFRTATAHAHIFLGVLRSMGAVFTGINAAVLMLGASTSNVFRGWERQMVRTKAVSGALSDDIEKMKKQSFDLGISTGSSPTDVAGGMAFMGMAGLTPEAIRDTIGEATKIGKIGMMDIATAADLTTNIMRGFNMETAQAGKLTDILAGTLTTSNTDMRQLGDAMKYVASTSSSLSISAAETSAAIGMLGDAGIQGEMAGAGLRTSLTRLAKPTKQAKAVMDAYNISIDERTLKQEGLIGVLQRLEKADMSYGNVAKIVGTRAGPLFAQLLTQGSEALQIREKYLNEVADSSLLLEAITQSLDHKMSVASATMETLAIVAGERFTRAFGVAAEMLIESAGGADQMQISAANAADEGIMVLVESWVMMLQVAADLLPVLALITDALRLIWNTAKLLGGAFSTLGTAMLLPFVSLFKIIKDGANATLGWLEKLASARAELSRAQFDDEEALKWHDIARALRSAKEEGKEFSKSIAEVEANMVGFGRAAAMATIEAGNSFNPSDMTKFLDKALEIRAKIPEITKALEEFKKRVGDADMTEEEMKRRLELEQKLAKQKEDLAKAVAAAAKPWKGDNFKNTDSSGGAGKDPLNWWRELANANREINNLLSKQYDFTADIFDLKQRYVKGELTEEQFRTLGILRAQERILEVQNLRKADAAAVERELADYKQKQYEAGQAAAAVEESINKTIESRLRMRKEELDLVHGAVQQGLGMGGGTGLNAAASRAMQEVQAAYDYQQMEVEEQKAARVAESNAEIMKQIELIDKLGSSWTTMAQAIAPAIQEMAKAQASGEKTAIAMAEMNLHMQVANTVSSLGGELANLLSKDAKEAAQAQAILNGITAVYMAAMGAAAAGTGNVAAAAGYFTGAATLGLKAATGLIGAGKMDKLQAVPATNKAEESKAQADIVKKGVLDALKESGLYQPWERLTIDTYGTTPVDFGGGDNLPSARNVEYGRQMMQRSRG